MAGTPGNQGVPKKRQPASMQTRSPANRGQLRDLLHLIDSRAAKLAIACLLLGGFLTIVPWGAQLLGIVINVPLGIAVLCGALLMLIVALCIIWTLRRWVSVAIALLTMLLFWFGGVQFVRNEWTHGQPKLECSMYASATSEIVARLYSRATILPSGTTEVYRPQFQDLFHDWIIKLSPNGTALTVVVTIQDESKPFDHMRVDPPGGAVITDVKPGWLSGFDEPSHAPDFFVRTVTFAFLDGPATITIRRPIKHKTPEVNTITATDLDLDRIVRVSAQHCSLTDTPRIDKQNRFATLVDQLRVLALWKGGPGHPNAKDVITRRNPDEPFPPLPSGESEMIVEARCKNAPCKNLSITMAGHGKW